MTKKGPFLYTQQFVEIYIQEIFWLIFYQRKILLL